MLRQEILAEKELAAGDIFFKFGTGKITISDLLAVKKHILGISNITQS